MKPPSEEMCGKSTQGIHTVLKSTFTGFQHCRWRCGSSSCV